MAVNFAPSGAVPPVRPQQLEAFSDNLANIKEVIDFAWKGMAEAAKAAGAPDYEESMRQMAAAPGGMLLGAGALPEDFGGTPISLPGLSAPTRAALDMGSLSTADLLQVLRTESRKTTELLLGATMESIKNLQSQIDINSASSIADLEKAAKAHDKAEKLQKIMNVVKWVAIAAGSIAAVAAIVLTAGAAGPLIMAGISVAMLLTTTVLSQVKDENGKSPMDTMMEGLAKGMQKLAASMDKQPEWLKVVEAAAAAVAAVALAVFVDPKTLSLTLPLVAMAAVSALPDKMMSEEMKGQVMASIAMVGVMVAVSVYAAGAAASAGTASTSAIAGTAATTTSATSRLLAQAGTALQALMELTQGGMGVAKSVVQFNADKAQAEVTALKEMVKMLQTLLDNDSSFIEMLADIQAQLDAGVAQVVALEHQTQENIDKDIFS
jgi:hypothetical protein